MSMISKVTIDQAKIAVKMLRQKLAVDFAESAKPLIGDIDLDKINSAEWGVGVELLRKPSVDDQKNLPATVNNVKVNYKVIDCGDAGHVCGCNTLNP